MARIHTHPNDTALSQDDKLLGSEDGTNTTKNYTLKSISDFFGTTNSIAVGGQVVYAFQESPTAFGQGQFMINSNGGGNNTALQSMTTLVINKALIDGRDAEEVIKKICNSKIRIYGVTDINTYSDFDVVSITNDSVNANTLSISLTGTNGRGNLINGNSYAIISIATSASTITNLPTATTSVLGGVKIDDVTIQINSGTISVKTVDTAQIDNDAVTQDKIAVGAVGSSEVSNGIITGQTLLTSLSSNDKFLVVDASDSSALKRTNLSDIQSYMQANLSFSATDVDVNVANLTTRLGQISSNVTIGNANTVVTTTAGNLTVGGDLIVNGTTTTVNSTTLAIDDHHIKVATDNNTTNDFGFYGRYKSNAKFAGFNYSSSNNKWQAYDQSTVEPGNTTFTPSELADFEAAQGIFSSLVLNSTSLLSTFAELNEVRTGSNIKNVKPTTSDGFLIKDTSDTGGGSGGTIKMVNGTKFFNYIEDQITGAISTVVTSNLTANRAAVSNGSGKLVSSDITVTELDFLDGVSSNIQTQLDAKQATISAGAGIDIASNVVSLETDLRGEVNQVGSSSDDYIAFEAGSGNRTDFFVGGSLIGSFLKSGSNTEIHSAGDVVAFSSTYSDARLKEDIQPIQGALNIVSNLRGVEYTWKKGYRKGQREVGLIAQEVEQVVPCVVKEKQYITGSGLDDTSSYYKTLEYSKLIPILIEANKELQGVILDLQARVFELENKL